MHTVLKQNAEDGKMRNEELDRIPKDLTLGKHLKFHNCIKFLTKNGYFLISFLKKVHFVDVIMSRHF